MKLIGYINGEEVKFDYFPPNQFVAQIPKQVSGHYSLYLKCIDDGGNEAGLAGVYLCIDFQNMSFKILEKVYSEKVNLNNYNYEALSDKYEHGEEGDNYCFNELASKYSYKVVIL